MDNIYLFIFFGIIGVVGITTMICAIISCVKTHKQYCRLFDADGVNKYEGILQTYLKEHNINLKSCRSHEELCNAFDVELVYVHDRKIIGANSSRLVVENGQNTMYLIYPLEYKYAHRAIAVELARLVLGESLDKIIDHWYLIGKSDESAIREFIALGILLPFSLLEKEVNEMNFFKMTKRQKKLAIYSLAEKYRMEEDHVIQRLIDYAKVRNI